MEEEAPQVEELVSKGLETMLPADVHIALTKYAKEVSKTGLGKWDYGVAIRNLLRDSQILSLMGLLGDKIMELEERMKELEKEEKGVKTMGGRIE